MSETIVYIDKSRVKEGCLDDLEAAMTELVAFVDANEPDVQAYSVYFDEDGSRMTVVQIHPDADSLAYHMDVAGPKFPPIGAFIELESIDVYGPLSEDLVKLLEEKASMLGSGRVSIHDLHRGIDRVPVDGAVR